MKFFTNYRIKRFTSYLNSLIRDKSVRNIDIDSINFPANFEGFHFGYLTEENKKYFTYIFREPCWQVIVLYSPENKKHEFSLCLLSDDLSFKRAKEDRVPKVIQDYVKDCIVKDPGYFEKLVKNTCKQDLKQLFGI